MKKTTILFLFILLAFIINAQTKKIFLEEFTSAWCGFSVDGTYYIDSMLNKYPELISVSCHAGWGKDSFFFEEIDTLIDGITQQPSGQSVPSAAIDRLYYPTDTTLGTWHGVIQIREIWDTLIQQRLNIPANLTVGFDSISWDSISRDITAYVNVDIVTNMPADDYRIGLYIVEDSIMGYQYNSYYDTIVGHPYYGQGSEIFDFYHRRVARALLPSTWGQQGILPPLLNAGQNFTYTVNYNLPDTLYEDQISLIAFVYRYSANHQNDEVLNVEQVSLYYTPVNNGYNIIEKNEIYVYPNPTTGKVRVRAEGIQKAEVMDMQGRIVLSQKTNLSADRHEDKNQKYEFDLSNQTKGIYIIKVTTDKGVAVGKVVLE